jgi:hypothetical protein
MRSVRGAWSSEAAGAAAAAAARHRIAACFVVPMLHDHASNAGRGGAEMPGKTPTVKVWRDRYIAAFSSKIGVAAVRHCTGAPLGLDEATGGLGDLPRSPWPRRPRRLFRYSFYGTR